MEILENPIFQVESYFSYLLNSVFVSLQSKLSTFSHTHFGTLMPGTAPKGPALCKLSYYRVTLNRYDQCSLKLNCLPRCLTRKHDR